MRIERVEPLRVADDLAAANAALVNAAHAVDAPHLPAETAATELGYLRYGWENRPPDAVFFAYDDAGSLVGRTYVELPMHDNLDIAVLGLHCHPAHRGGDLPDRLLEVALSEVTSVGRRSVLVDAWADSFWQDFYLRNGFEVGYRAAQRRLRTRLIDWTKLDQLATESAAASAGYDLVEMPIPAAAEQLPGLLGLHHAMNDAPNEDLDIEDEVWDEARARSWEQVHINRRLDVLRLVAVRRSDGAYGGYTVLTVESERPTLGFQDDTGVVGEHRGHRLGVRLKIAMLHLLRERHPQVELIDTWNAESNGPMIAVNDALGFQVVARDVELQRSVDL